MTVFLVVRAGGPINVLPFSGGAGYPVPFQGKAMMMLIVRLPRPWEISPRARDHRALVERACRGVNRHKNCTGQSGGFTTQANPGAKVVQSSSRVVLTFGLDATKGVGYGFGSCSSGATLGQVYSQLHARRTSRWKICFNGAFLVHLTRVFICTPKGLNQALTKCSSCWSFLGGRRYKRPQVFESPTGLWAISLFMAQVLRLYPKTIRRH